MRMGVRGQGEVRRGGADLSGSATDDWKKSTSVPSTRLSSLLSLWLSRLLASRAARSAAASCSSALLLSASERRLLLAVLT